MEKIFNVKGMHCASCEVLLSDVIGEIQGVEQVSVSYKQGIVSVHYTDLSVLDAVKKAIEKEGYQVLS